ncbi:TARGETING PROTEIN FOR XKLP2 [Salix purpurea]|uniref:TARGETING PROTEIN FOR XKLP2 n=1 Tax=Salix purpurea TaxID=77065 RepID=A0A9Q0WGE6_SALPP|nr:TARGETING PROTEIN FOR XKLP2 [Salix purpurea]
MELNTKKPKTATPVKDRHVFQSKLYENSNPNLSHLSPCSKPTNSPRTKSKKAASKNPTSNPNPTIYSPRNKIRERRFVVAKKNSKKENLSSNSTTVDCKCKERYRGSVKKCLCLAFETLRASQEEFFKNKNNGEEKGKDQMLNIPAKLRNRDKWVVLQSREREIKLLEEARNSALDNGKVKNLVKAFEKLCTLPSPKESDKTEEEDFTMLGYLRQTFSSSSSFCPSGLFLTSENLGLGTRISISSSWDGSQGSSSSRSSNGGRRSRRNSAESGATTGRRRLKKKQNKITSQKPFQLRTEQRGRLKEEEFTKKIQEIMMEEEKLRIPIAQGLPWTTDEPESLIKPLVKEKTRPIDLKLHSDVRAVERADFDQQLAEKMSLIEQYKMEIERQQKVAEEEEVRRLRKELVPKAQPMPYFDRPFIPRSSMRHPTTMPKEEKFRGHKKIKSCQS